MTASKRILITGANGFIGSFVVEEALRRGYEVWAGVRAGSNLQYLTHPDIRFAQLPYENPDLLADYLKNLGRFDVVVHNAGVVKARSDNDFNRINYLYSRHLIQALIDSSTVPDQFIYMSSLSVNGPGDPSGQPICLKDTPHPDTAYGKSKLRVERFLQQFSDFPYIILRPTGVYGPRDTDYFSYIQLTQKGIQPSIGFRTQYLSFIYVKDLAELILNICESKYRQKIWLVSDGMVYTGEEYGKIVCKALGKQRVLKLRVPVSLIFMLGYSLEFIMGLFGILPLLNRDKVKILSCFNWACDSEALQRELCFQAKHPLEQGIRESVQWYKDSGWLK